MPARRIVDDLEKPDRDGRSYRVIELPNKLEALLAHDAQTDRASASLSVDVGNFSDDDDMPGMAHAVEHLLLMGTEKVRFTEAKTGIAVRSHRPVSRRKRVQILPLITLGMRERIDVGDANNLLLRVCRRASARRPSSQRRGSEHLGEWWQRWPPIRRPRSFRAMLRESLVREGHSSSRADRGGKYINISRERLGIGTRSAAGPTDI